MQIADVLRAQVERQGANSLLPTEHELARRFAVSRVTIRQVSLAKTTSDPPSWGARLCKDHSPRRTEVIGSITNRRIYSRSTVNCGGKRERFTSWRADQWVGRELTVLDGRIDGGGHRLREAARPGRQLALR